MATDHPARHITSISVLWRKCGKKSVPLGHHRSCQTCRMQIQMLVIDILRVQGICKSTLSVSRAKDGDPKLSFSNYPPALPLALTWGQDATGLRTPSSLPPSDIPDLVFSQKRPGPCLGILFLSVMTWLLLLLAWYLVSALGILGAYDGLPLLLLLVES